jgi:hypothetical protein
MNSLLGQQSFLGMVKPIGKVFICLSLKEVTARSDQLVLMKVDNNILMIAAKLQEILDVRLALPNLLLKYNNYL